MKREKIKMTLAEFSALPLSTRCRMAVDDAIALSKAKRGAKKKYILAMDYLVAREKGTCTVCMAGATMVRRLGHVGCRAYFRDNENALAEVDHFRRGSPSCTNGELYATINALILGDFSFYRDGGRARWSTYRKAIKILAEAGL